MKIEQIISLCGIALITLIITAEIFNHVSPWLAIILPTVVAYLIYKYISKQKDNDTKI